MAERPIYGVVFNPKGVRWNFGDPLAAGDLPSQMKIGRRVAWGKFKLEAHYPNVNPGIDEAGLKHTEVKKGDYDTRKGAQDAFKAKWNNQEIEGLKKNCCRQQTDLVAPGKGGVWSCGWKGEIRKDMPGKTMQN